MSGNVGHVDRIAVVLLDLVGAMDEIYLDNNATTPLLPAVWEAMRPYATDCFGNPASAHWAGRRARHALEDARERVASLLGANPDEVIFTSGATEANNLAIFGLAGESPSHLITTPIEHPSVAEPIERLEKRGFCISRMPVDSTGIVDPESVRELVEPQTRLVSVMLANNETGAVQPVKQLSCVLHGRIAFHCDGAQAVGRVPVHFYDLGITALTFSAHKFHGPTGIGALLLRRDAKCAPQLWGGHQQQGRRPGTEAVALVIGLRAALDLAERERDTRISKVLHLRARFLHSLRERAGPVVLNGPEVGGVPHTLNLSFPGCRADSLLMNLDLAGVACSTGSACSSGSLLPSPVLRAMRVSPEVLHSAMRFSFHPFLTEEEIDEAANRIARVVARLRETEDE
jgi:cysteine desulfurase